MGFLLTFDFTDINRKEMFQWLYGLINTPSGLTIWEWLVRFEVTYAKHKKRNFVDMHETVANRKYQKEQMTS